MVKKKVLSFFVLFLAFAAVMAVIEVAQFGSILGFSVNQNLIDVEISDFSGAFFILAVFTVIFFFAYRYTKSKIGIRRLKKNFDGEYINIKV